MRRFAFLLLLAIALAVAAPALAHEGHVHGPGPITVVELEGPMDQRTIDFATHSVTTTTGQVLVLLIDSPGVASGDLGELVTALQEAPIPIGMWVGPQGAVAYGGSAQLLALADFAGAAPGVHVGYTDPTVARDGSTAAIATTPGLWALKGTRVEIAEDVDPPDFVDFVTPSIGQFLAALDGLEINGQVIETVDQTTLADGSVITVPSVDVGFVKPGLFTRFLRLSIRPDATFFFLVAGLALIAFEFYAAGVGVTAAVAVLALFLAAYGLGTLPVRWWAVAVAVGGVLLLTWDFQRSRFFWRSLAGVAAMMVGGLSITSASPQFGPRWWVVLVVAAGTALFYGFAMTTVVRARYSTPTIGREHLIGRSAVAETDLDPDGVVAVDGARWRASSHRAAGIARGDAVAIVAVREVTLEVEPLAAEPISTDSGAI